VPVVAVTPIVGGQALKGPAAKMMRELGLASSAEAVAAWYARYPGLLQGFILDDIDRAQQAAIETLGMRVRVANTVMKNAGDRGMLASVALDFAQEIAGHP
jgi:LPPG:FO 2-phospho-L-lactate transferase